MKEIFKTMGFIFSLMLIGCTLNASASEIKQVVLVNSTLGANSSSIGKVTDCIEKKEDVLVKNFEFLGDLGKSDYKYIKVLRDVVYSDSLSQNTIAKASTEANFRCNALTRESECLSCNYTSSINVDDSYVVGSFARPANKNTELGSSLSSFKLKRLGKLLCKDSKEIDCDYTGNVKVRPIELNS